VLLYEAHAAKQYWKFFRTLLPAWTNFSHREPHYGDITNRLLDIGYHHLGTCVEKIFTTHEASTALGLLHVAQKSDSTPIVYDLMELFRADVIDMTVLTFLRQKKKPILRLGQKDIAHFIYEVRQRLAYLHYLKDFKQCHPYNYYLELQIVKFMKAVNHRELFQPMELPDRHDTRCPCVIKNT
jgi:CRISPR-associated endonuclease Cas1